MLEFSKMPKSKNELQLTTSIREAVGRGVFNMKFPSDCASLRMIKTIRLPYIFTISF